MKIDYAGLADLPPDVRKGFAFPTTYLFYTARLSLAAIEDFDC